MSIDVSGRLPAPMRAPTALRSPKYRLREGLVDDGQSGRDLEAFQKDGCRARQSRVRRRLSTRVSRRTQGATRMRYTMRSVTRRSRPRNREIAPGAPAVQHLRVGHGCSRDLGLLRSRRSTSRIVCSARALGVADGNGIEAEHHQVRGGESRALRLEADQRLHEEPGGHEQDQRKRNLPGDQQLACADAAAARRIRALRHRRTETQAPQLEDGRQTADHTGQERWPQC